MSASSGMSGVLGTPPAAGGFSRVGVVLLRPKSPGNVGSVARAMKNMGFSRLVVADPMTYEDPSHFDTEAGRMAWQAEDVLAARRLEPDLAAALSPFHLVVGTSSRAPDGARVLTARETAAAVADYLASRPEAMAALLFGQEDIGLTNDDLSRCHVIGSIPSAPAYVSLNLAQAALVFLYELRLALGGVAPGSRPVAGADPPSHGQLEAFYGRLEAVLDEIGFLQGTARAHMMRELRMFFNRALLDSRELEIFEGVARQISWASRRRG